MDSPGNMENLNHMVEAVALSKGSDSDNSAGQKDTSLADMLRIKHQMSNQCFEMAVQLLAGQSKRSDGLSEAERDLPDYVSELERVKTIIFNSTLTLHRMQMWHAIGEKLKENDSEADSLKAVSERCMTLCTNIKQLQQESRDLQDEITELQKKRLEMKRLTREKLKEMEELMSKKQHPDTEKYKAALEKGLANLEKYKKMAVMTQNVLRGIILACKVNWMDDPKIRDIAMTLEELPYSD
ncbi:centromere protein H [Antennarius striatus]|uniref:centromere protein H n=1 Tax=Antennarius striatus TaxID=241820 RepID=UPI0035ADD16F